MTTDTLDALTDTQLSELFTLEVAGPAEHKWMETLDGDMCDHCGYMRWQHEYRPQSCSIQYAWDVNEVIPYLEKWGEWCAKRIGSYGYEIVCNTPNPIVVTGQVFARTACIALIRSTRALKTLS